MTLLLQGVGKGPELLVKYVGESELAVLSVFQRACSSSPCIVFFDELDSVCPKRGKGDGGGGGVSERVVNSLLSKWMGWKVDAAELIDPSMMRL